MSYMGTMLRVNLSNGSITREKTPMDLAKQYVGGRGMATRMLINEIDPKVDALSPGNKLIYASGPLTNTSAPTGGRYMVVTKSPLTGTAACSNSGGEFGAFLKKAGYDFVIFEGKADKPVYLYVNDDQVELRDASAYWGKSVYEVTDKLIADCGNPKAKVSCIGPGGEQMSLIASVMNEKDRAAGRSGVGAVMGSKNLKAIVAFGTGRSPLADEPKFKEIIKTKIGQLKENPITGQGLPGLGTKVLDNIINQSGMYPTRNFQQVMFDGTENMSGEALVEKGYLQKNTGCYMCPIRCARDVVHPNGRHGEGPEYESGWAFGPMCGIDDLAAIVDANFTCNDLGLDTISAGVTIACLMELYEKGYIPKEDLEKGPEPVFGSTEAMIYYLRKMGLSQGIIGKRMAQGSYRLGEAYGHPELAMVVKKQELPAYDPRGVQGMGLSYATSNRGGCHVRCYMISPEILGAPEKLDPQELKDKPQWVMTMQDLTAVIDSSGLCLFTSFAVDLQGYTDMINAATGFNYTPEELLACGTRTWNLERQFNLASGVTPAEDTLPKRVLEVPAETGPNKGQVHRLGELLPEYYQIRGWDTKGIPTDATLKELGVV